MLQLRKRLREKKDREFRRFRVLHLGYTGFRGSGLKGFAVRDLGVWGVWFSCFRGL